MEMKIQIQNKTDIVDHDFKLYGITSINNAIYKIKHPNLELYGRHRFIFLNANIVIDLTNKIYLKRRSLNLDDFSWKRNNSVSLEVLELFDSVTCYEGSLIDVLEEIYSVPGTFAKIFTI